MAERNTHAAAVIQEEGPREGFQIEPAPIAVADKIRFIEALALTGLPALQCTSFVNPAQVPQMADTEAVAAGIRRRPGVRHTGLWLNIQGLKRASVSGLLRRAGWLSVRRAQGRGGHHLH
jgi:hydroxymethylglutaryl-CoA lyase